MGRTLGVALALFVAFVLLIGAAAVGIAQTVFGAAAPTSCGGTSAVAGYQPDQMANAAVIVADGQRMNVPEQGWVVAITAALQESGLHNVNHGDRDSLGLFQERPSQGWGTPAQIMDPTYSTTQFYNHLLAVPNWQDMSVNDAAQAVERSAFPTAYAQHEQSARTIVAAIQGDRCTRASANDTTCTSTAAPNATALSAVVFACAQLGLPYQWGGNGPQQGNAGFDCSGLTKAAYATAGITLPRTADTQFRASPSVPQEQPLLPGDLVFYGTTAHIHHVGLYLGAGLMIDAPDFGQVVRVQPYRWPNDQYAGATRPSE